MKNESKTNELNKGLDVLELEERLEMVNLTAVAAESSWRCDDNDVDIKEEALTSA
jgi:hypothetical protein